MKKLFIEDDIIKIVKQAGKVLNIKEGDIITPAAKDKIREFNITVIKEPKNKFQNSKSAPQLKILGKTLAIGSDHTGYKLKSILSNLLKENNYNIKDVGTFNEDSCDYPDFAESVANKVISGEVGFGILIDATGIPSAITANKIPGIRAATCYNEFSARSAREHNNANILVLGAKALGEETVKSILDVFIKTEFAGERHQKRLDKISMIEEKHSKKVF